MCVCVCVCVCVYIYIYTYTYIYIYIYIKHVIALTKAFSRRQTVSGSECVSAISASSSPEQVRNLRMLTYADACADVRMPRSRWAS